MDVSDFVEYTDADGAGHEIPENEFTITSCEFVEDGSERCLITAYVDAEMIGAITDALVKRDVRNVVDKLGDVVAPTDLYVGTYCRRALDGVFETRYFYDGIRNAINAELAARGVHDIQCTTTRTFANRAHPHTCSDVRAVFEKITPTD